MPRAEEPHPGTLESGRLQPSLQSRYYRHLMRFRKLARSPASDDVRRVMKARKTGAIGAGLLTIHKSHNSQIEIQMFISNQRNHLVAAQPLFFSPPRFIFAPGKVTVSSGAPRHGRVNPA